MTSFDCFEVYVVWCVDCDTSDVCFFFFFFIFSLSVGFCLCASVSSAGCVCGGRRGVLIGCYWALWIYVYHCGRCFGPGKRLSEATSY